MSLSIKVGARDSPLSKAQVKEVLDEIRKKYPTLDFEAIYVKSTGDLNKTVSLRQLDKTDFFTKEIDDMVLQNICRIGIHSAKDLPEPLPKGLKLVYLTQGLNPSDALVMPAGKTLASLPLNAKIGTSSQRREESVRKLRSDFTFFDIRGTIEERLAKMECGELDALVIAEAALIRLKLTHLNRILLTDATVPGQGKLAVLARENDSEIATFFTCT